MIAGYQLEPSDIRRLLFRSLVTFIGDSKKFDAFEAVAGALYTEGKFDTSDDDPYSHPEMSLELRLNVVAFYHWCAHFPFTSPLLEYWSLLAIEEYKFAADQDLLTSFGLTDFNGDLLLFSEQRLEWSDNFSLLAHRLHGANKPPLWMDLYALQLLFFKKARSVLFAPVYGFATKQPGDTGMYFAHPQVPDMDSLTNIPGLTDPQPFDLPPLFTVVPLLATTITTYGCLKHPQDDDATDIALCQQLKNFAPKDQLGTVQFRRTQPQFSVIEGQVDKLKATFKPEHCASNALCNVQDGPSAMVVDHRCPGCHKPVHQVCGYLNPTVEKSVDQITCLVCFDRYGKVFDASGLSSSSLRSTPSSMKLPTCSRSPRNRMGSGRSPSSSEARHRTGNDAIDESNPDYMYPEDITPVNIIKTAISLRSFLRTSADSGLCGPDVPGVYDDYPPQDLVNLPCLVAASYTHLTLPTSSSV